MSIDFAKTVVTEDYPAARPFPCARMDGLLDEQLVERAAIEAENVSEFEAGWVDYDNPLEKKRVSRSSFRLADALTGLQDHLRSAEWLEFLAAMTGIDGLVADDELYGAGLSVVPRGGYLALHRDLELHPHTGLERRLNLAVFLNRDWDDDWGGHLELWHERDGKPYMCGRRVRPTLGRIMLFDPQGFHGFPDPVRCPAETSRLSVQVFYYAPARETAKRTRAMFVPRPQDDCVRMLNEFRLANRQPG